MEDLTRVLPPDATAEDGEALIADAGRTQVRFAAMRVLVDVGAPEALRDGPLPVTELAARCGAHAPTLTRLLRSVAQTGLLRSVPPDGYALTPAGHALLEGRQAMMLKFQCDPEVFAGLGDLTETVRTGKSPFNQRHGSLYHYLSGKPEVSKVFDAFMNVQYLPLAERAAEAGDFRAGQTIVDVGGGQGTFLGAILQANPGTRGILLDLARSIPVAQEYLAGIGVADRCELVAGDFFAEVPAGGDAYLLGHVIHNWGDEECLQILRMIRAVIPADGLLLLVEVPLSDDDSPQFGKDLDVRLLATHSGGERSRSQYSALLAEAGFALTGSAHLLRGECLISASPVGS